MTLNLPKIFALLLLVFSLSACGTVGSVMRMSSVPSTPAPGTEEQIVELTKAIQALGPEVDAEEAERAARISYEHTYKLALEYEITDPALVHNVKVNMGLKPRGLCKHWAEDMEKRLVAEDFETLTIHRAIGGLIGVDHSTSIISRKGDDMFAGIVVDPWREGGVLTWIHTIEDTQWGWEPQLVVLDRLARQLALEEQKSFAVYEAQGVGQRCLDVSSASAPSVAMSSPEGLEICGSLLSSVSDPAAIADDAVISF